MKKGRRYVVAAILVALWAACLSIARALLAPAVGLEVVNQLDASNAAYVFSAGAGTGAHLVNVLITVVFAALVVLVLRSR